MQVIKIGDNMSINSLLDMMPVSLLLVDDNGCIVFINKAMSGLSQYHPSEIQGKKVECLVPKASRQRHIKYRDNYQCQQQNRRMGRGLDIYLISKSGSEIPVEISLSFIEHMNKKYFMCAVNDVTQKKYIQNMLTNANAILEQRVKERITEYELLYENAPDMFISLSIEDFDILQCNHNMIKTLGYTAKEEVIGKNIFDFFDPSKIKEIKLYFAKLAHSADLNNVETELQKKDGSSISVSLKINIMRNDQGEKLYYMSIWRDVTLEREIEIEREHYRISEKLFTEDKALYDSILDSATDGWWDWNLETNEEYLSPKFKSLFGYSDEELPNHADSWKKIIFPDDLSKALKAFDAHIINNKPYDPIVRYRCKNGDIKWILCRGKAIRDSDGKFRRMVGTHTDITDLKNAEKELQSLAHYDALTQLVNRSYFYELLNHAIDYSKRNRKLFAVLYVDLDNFKIINDTFGHDVGNLFLIEVARLLKSAARDTDVISRLGGDEFVLILEDITSIHHALGISERILKSFDQPFCIDQHEIHSSASIGIALYPANSDDAVTLMSYADTAMYRAKSSGKNTFYLFSDDLNESHKRQLLIANRLRNAIGKSEFKLVYQPLISLESGKLYGLEALIRWHTEELGTICPDEFIPIAENSGFIMELSDWVIDTSLSHFYDWKEHHQKLSRQFDLMLSINVSALQLNQNKTIDILKSKFKKYSISPDQIILEITETNLMEKIEVSKNMLHEFMKLGVKIAIDDFGTGYSSLSYLKNLPFSYLKIDKSFIEDVVTCPNNSAIVNSIVQLGKIMGLSVTAEGVETEEQLSYLKQIGCHGAQGYFLSKPLSFSHVSELYFQ